MEPKKICYLNHDKQNRTGAGRFYNALTEAVGKILPNWPIEVLTSEDILYPNKIKLLLAFPAIRKIFQKCDIIHALDGWPYGVIAALVSVGLKKKLIITAVGTGAVQPLYSWWRRPIMKWAYQKADRVIAVSNNTKREIQKFLPNLKIDVINHGVDAKKFEILYPTSHLSPLTSSISYLKPYIFSVGALKKRKGFEYSIKAFAEMAPKFPDLKYVIAGKGVERENLRVLSSKLKVSDRLVFLDSLSEEEIIALYKNAELFILLPQDDNKDIEGFGLVFLEAAAAGLPVIGVKDTSVEDAVRDGQNGILVSSQDYQEAAKMMIKILSDQNLKKSFSEESIKSAKEMSWEKVAQAYKKNYDQ